jgi:hypothetical protein
MREFFQVIDFRLPHNTGLVFEIDQNAARIDGFYPVADIIVDGFKLSPDHYSISCTVLLEGFSEEYLCYLVERTKNTLLEEVKATNAHALLEENFR